MTRRTRQRTMKGDLKSDWGESDFFDYKDDKRKRMEEGNPYKLTSYFYSLLSKVRERTITSRNIYMDLRLAKDFLAAVEEELELFPTEAFEVAQEMIYDLIENEEQYGLRYPVANLGILGQGKMKFITELMFKRRASKEFAEATPEYDEYIGNKYAEEEDYIDPLENILLEGK